MIFPLPLREPEPRAKVDMVASTTHATNKISQSQSTSPSGPTFTLFSHLPPELRLQIWESALPLTYLGRDVCVLTPEAVPLGTRIHDPLVVRDPLTALHGTCRESRDVALALARRGAATRPYDPATDLLYVGRRNFSAFASDRSSTGCRSPAIAAESPSSSSPGAAAAAARGNLGPPFAWTAQVRHLAVPASFMVAEHEMRLLMALQNLPALEHLTVVYPRRAGTVDVQTDVVVPAGTRRLALRRLTGPELGRLRVAADYVFDTWAGGCPALWNRTAAEHLELWRKSIETRAGPISSFYKRPACWDPATGRLRLEFEARCFESDLDRMGWDGMGRDRL